MRGLCLCFTLPEAKGWGRRETVGFPTKIEMFLQYFRKRHYNTLTSAINITINMAGTPIMNSVNESPSVVKAGAPAVPPAPPSLKGAKKSNKKAGEPVVTSAPPCVNKSTKKEKKPKLTTVESSPAEESTGEPVKKEKKPTLPAKYNKLMVFGFWLIETLHKKDLISDRDGALSSLNTFASVNDQIAFLNSFFDDFKSSQKLFKSIIRNHFKISKPKTTKPSKLNSPTTLSDKPKRGRKKIIKNNSSDHNNELIHSLVHAANAGVVLDETTKVVVDTIEIKVDEVDTKLKRKNTKKQKNEESKEPVEVEPVEKVVKDKKVKETKEKTKTNKKAKEVVVEPELESEPVEKVVKDKKVKETKEKKTNKKTKEVVVEPEPETESVVENNTNNDEDEDEDDEVEVEVSPFVFENKNYLIDVNNVLYDTETYEPIGKFHDNSIIPM
jgi:hypothetical protein